MVTDGLLVSSVDVAHDLSLLKQLSVTHILNVASGVPNAFPKVLLQSLFVCMCMSFCMPILWSVVCVVCCRLLVGYSIVLLLQDFVYQVEEMYDDEEDQIMQHYMDCEVFIDEGRKKGTVLVHW